MTTIHDSTDRLPYDGPISLWLMPGSRKDFRISPLWTTSGTSVELDAQAQSYRGLTITAYTASGHRMDVHVFLDSAETATLMELLQTPMTVEDVEPSVEDQQG